MWVGWGGGVVTWGGPTNNLVYPNSGWSWVRLRLWLGCDNIFHLVNSKEFDAYTKLLGVKINNYFLWNWNPGRTPWWIISCLEGKQQIWRQQDRVISLKWVLNLQKGNWYWRGKLHFISKTFEIYLPIYLPSWNISSLLSISYIWQLHYIGNNINIHCYC